MENQTTQDPEAKKGNNEIWVKGNADVGKVAASIYNAFEKTKDEPIVRAIGAGALNQAIKAIIISNKQFIKVGKMVLIAPAFKSVQLAKEFTSIELKLKIINV